MSLHLQHRQSLSFYMGELSSRVRLLNISILLWRGELFSFRATSISAFCGEPRTQFVFIGKKLETASCCFECIASDGWCLDHIVFYLICFLFISIIHHCVYLFSSISPSGFGSAPSFLYVQRQLSNMEPVTSTVMVTTANIGNSPTRSKAFTWACKLLRQGSSELGVIMEGKFVQVIPIRECGQGFELKLVFHDIPESTMQELILPTLEKEGPTRQCNVQEENAQAIRRREFAQNKASQAAAIGDVADTKKFLKELMEMRNDEDDTAGQEGGCRGGKRKLAANCAEIFARSTRICDSKFQENKE